MAFRASLCLVAGLTGWILLPDHPRAGGMAFLVACVAGGWDLTIEVWHDLQRPRLDTHFLMWLVVPGAALIGAWQEAALLLVLFSIASTLELYAQHRTRGEINALLDRTPPFARLLTPDGERPVPAATLRTGDRIRVLANELAPVDFTVVTGETASDESLLTGESVPVPKASGDIMAAGTLNLWGIVEGSVLRPAADSTLQRILRLIESAQKQKAPSQRFSDRFGTAYTGAVLAACCLLFLVTWLVQDHPPLRTTPTQPSAFYRAMTLLVVLSPCALVLSVPSAILSAIARSARTGVLFRGGAAVETLAQVSLVAFDKTGTLTEGRLTVVHVEVLEGSRDAATRLAGRLAPLSNHPLSEALARAYPRPGDSPPLTDVRTEPGKGVAALDGPHPVLLGSRDHVLSSLRRPPPRSHTATPADQHPGATSEVWLAGPGLLARFDLVDQPRPAARQLIGELHAQNIETVMLTGDRPEIAQHWADQLGIQTVHAALQPADKLTHLTRFKDQGRRVAMVGDGVNDAPGLAAADVGIAMGRAGADAAMEQADLVLMQERIDLLPWARRLSVRARSLIQQNLWIALGTMGAMGVLTLLRADVPLAVGVAAHEGSTVVVMINSLRLLRFPLPPAPRTSGSRPNN